MREKTVAHRVRPDCSQCHKLMDPIGFALENFDGVGTWRTLDEGQPIDAADVMFDNAKVNGPSELRQWLATGYGQQFVTVAAEKLLIYALGRGLEWQDMTLVRQMSREAAKSHNRFSALVLAVARSQPFQMNTKIVAPVAPAAAPQAAVPTPPIVIAKHYNVEGIH